MTEYIEREKVKEALLGWDYDPSDDDVECAINHIPAADVVEVKRGEWKEHFAYDCWHYDCPFCDFGFATKIKNEDPPNYCENCGAKMDLKEGEEV